MTFNYVGVILVTNEFKASENSHLVNVFDPPEPQTGLKRIFLQGRDVQATLTITQDEPVPMQVLAAYLEISV